MGSPGSSGRHVGEVVMGNAGESRVIAAMALEVRVSEGRVLPRRLGNAGRRPIIVSLKEGRRGDCREATNT